VRRTKGMRLVFLALLLALAGRLYYVQVFCEEELTAAACGQQMISVLQENGKGTIYDRNMTPLTGTSRAYYYLIHKDNLTAGAKRQLTRMNAEPAGKKGENYLVYRTTRYAPDAAFVLQKKWKAYGFCIDVRYGENQTAEPLITDLDEMYGRLLQKSETSFYFLGNAAGNLIRGTGVKQTSEAENTKVEAAALVTTLDGELQQKIEALFKGKDVTGNAVITDIRSGQILAMVSRSGEAGTMETTPNLAVEQAYPLGAIYALFRKTASVLDMTPAEANGVLGLGSFVFDDYPGEAAGSILKGKQAAATAVQVSQVLVTLANQGEAVPLNFVMSTVQEESIPCIEIAEDGAEELAVLQAELAHEPLIGDGWAVGCCGYYAVVIHLEKGNPKEVYEPVTGLLQF